MEEKGVFCAALIEKDGRILVVMDDQLGVWKLPGARVNPAVTIEETLIMVTHKMTGIEVNNGRFIGFGQDAGSSRLILLFHIKTDQSLELKIEHTWVNFEDLKKIKNKDKALADFFRRTEFSN